MDGDKTHFLGLRAVLALWIVAGHMLLHEMFAGIYDAGFARHEDFGLAGNLIILRFLGIDLFFMLTGLVLTRRYFGYFGHHSTGRDMDRFFLHRLRVIWPLHAIMVGVIGLYALVGVPHPLSSGMQEVVFNHWPWTLLLNLLLMNGWGMMPVASWNEPAWSLSITFLIYLVFPNLLLILKRLPARVPVYIGLMVFLIVGYTVLRETILAASQSDGEGAIVRGLVFASVGCLIALVDRLISGDFWRRYGTFFPLLFFLLVVIWTYLYQFDVTVFHLTYPLLLLGLMHGRYRLLPRQLADFIGMRSFEIFMTHYPTLLLLRHLLGERLHAIAEMGTLPRIGCYIFAFGCVIAVADLAYRTVRKLST